MVQLLSGQKLSQTEVERLAKVLNTAIAPNFNVELKNDKITIGIDDFNNTLDLRADQAIAQDSLSKSTKTQLDSGPYIGDVFWKYDFQMAKNSGVHFKTTKSNSIFCTILFDEQETIQIKSQLNAYTSHHRILDSATHFVNWSGEKYFSALLYPEWEVGQLNLVIGGMTISGKFARGDTYDINKNYSKTLRNILKREFAKLFASKELTAMLLQDFKQKTSD